MVFEAICWAVRESAMEWGELLTVTFAALFGDKIFTVATVVFLAAPLPLAK